MNFLLLSLLFSSAGGVAFFFFGKMGALTANVSVLLSFEAIIAAAALVRLNRGVPSLDWKSVEIDAIERLLSRLEDVAKVYIAVVCLNLASIVILIATLYVERVDFAYKPSFLNVISSLFGGLLGLLISRMAYVVWLDLDIVRLQRVVIMSAALGDESKRQAELAKDAIEAMAKTRITQL